MYPDSEPSTPLKPAEFYALLALSRGDSHVYVLRAVIRNDSLGSVNIDLSNLYKLMQKLLNEALIDPVGEQPAGKSSQPRPHYAISAHGVIRLKEECQRLQHAVKIAQHADLLDTEGEPPIDIQRLLLGL